MFRRNFQVSNVKMVLVSENHGKTSKFLIKHIVFIHFPHIPLPSLGVTSGVIKRGNATSTLFFGSMMFP